MLDKSELFKKDSLFFAYEVGWINWIATEVKRLIDMFLIRQSNAKLQEFAKTEWHTNSNSDFLEGNYLIKKYFLVYSNILI